MSVEAVKTTSEYETIFNEIGEAESEIVKMCCMFLKILVGKDLADDVQEVFDAGICQNMTVNAEQGEYIIKFGGAIKHFAFMLNEPKQGFFVDSNLDDEPYLKDLLNQVNITIMEYELTPASANIDIATQLKPEGFISISLLDIANTLAGKGQLYSVQLLAFSARSLIRATVKYDQLKRSVTRLNMSRFVARNMIKDFGVLKEQARTNTAANLAGRASKDPYDMMSDTLFASDEKNYQFDMVGKILQAS